MKGDRKNIKQFKAILKKDLSLLFRKRIAIFVFGGPFILMFILLGVPALFSSQQALPLLIYNDDIGYNQTNIGEAIVGNITIYFSTDESIAVETADNLTVVQQTRGLGLFIPSNFSEIAYVGFPIIYTVDATQSLFTSSTFAIINSIATNVMTTFLANRSINDVQNIQIPATALPEELILGPKAASIALPLSYMIFLLIALNSGSYSLIGFAREKRMRTMETLLAYTFKHSLLVISKVITGLVASLGTTLSYVLGILVGTQIAGGSSSNNLFAIFGLNFNTLGAGDIIISLIFVVIALLISTLITMAVDCNVSREASERISPIISIGLAMFFYFVVMMNPLGTSSVLMINPFYWCYRLGLLLIAGKFNYEVAIYLLLIVGIITILIRYATRGIQKEKSLYLE
ncbi:MAG: ABC transporter permease [Candidatus Heimdallarchaeota archaeon]|nr:ABC transporter permease [Candidatus Heimdallarchaeota archaeon]MCK4955281.1 ABC transporter permease [Candidatus Heimdallarchaeota archaeon]